MVADPHTVNTGMQIKPSGAPVCYLFSLFLQLHLTELGMFRVITFVDRLNVTALVVHKLSHNLRHHSALLRPIRRLLLTIGAPLQAPLMI
jgi:hypothetical protein